MKPPKLRSGVVIAGERWRVAEVWARLTPYRAADQTTRIEGYTLGLRKVRSRR